MDLLKPTDQNDQVQIDENKDYFAELTSPGAKFDLTKYDNDPLKAAAAIAKGKYHADATLEIRNRQHDELRTDWQKLREEYNAGPKLKEYLDQIVNQQQTLHKEPPVDDVKPVYDPQEIEKLLDEKLSAKIAAREQERKEEANFRTVESKLAEHYGSNYQSALKQQVDQLGLDPQFVNTLARQHPEVLFRTLGIGRKEDNLFQSPVHSTQRRDQFAPAQKRTNSYYQKLRKEQPEVYRSPKVQDQMLKDYQALGSEFEDGDWNSWGHKQY